MNIDPKTPIAGLRPAVLKQVFRRGDFSTLTFAKTTKFSLDTATQKLQELTKLGWVAPQPRGRWATTKKGDRLATASLTPQITVAVARNLVREAVAAAEAINADRKHHYVVERLSIVGDLLEGSPDRKIGEVELSATTVTIVLATNRKSRAPQGAARRRNWDAFWDAIHEP